MQPSSQALPDMNEIMRRGRSAILNALPQNVGVLLSAGSYEAGFPDWVEECCGAVGKHICLGRNLARPERLPPHMEWIDSDCFEMSRVGNGQCDIFLADRSIEYLWPEQVIQFFLEAGRVTRSGGYLALSGSNRGIITALDAFRHRQQTIEFTIQEAVEVVELAGFSVTATKGTWLDRDLATGEMLPHAAVEANGWSVEERVSAGAAHPDYAFLWWLGARRTGSPPQAETLRRRVCEIFSAAWHERVRGMVVGSGQLHTLRHGRWVSHSPTGATSVVLFGPYISLPAGRYCCRFYVDKPPSTVNSTVLFDVVCLSRHPGSVASRLVELQGGRVVVDLEFELDRVECDIEFRCFGHAGALFLCYHEVHLWDLREKPTVDLSVFPATGPDLFEPEDYAELDYGLLFKYDSALVHVESAERGNAVMVLRQRLADDLSHRRN